MAGFPLAGSAFAMDRAHGRLSWAVPGFGAAMVLLFLAIYSYNAYCGSARDVSNQRLRSVTALPAASFLTYTALFFFIGLLGLAFLHPWLAAAGMFSFGAWAWYSASAKGKPPLGTVVHFTTQILHFAMGWWVVAPLEPKAFLIALYTAMLFSAGHLVHEVIDFDADRAAGITTLPVRIGAGRSRSMAALVVFLSGIYWIGLYSAGIVDAREFLPFFVAFVAHASTLVLMAAQGTLSRSTDALRLRALYRFYYLAAGLVFVALRLMQLGER